MLTGAVHSGTLDRMKKLSPLERAIEFAGGQTALASVCGVHQSTVWYWLNKRSGKVPAPFVEKVVKAVRGRVTAEELRPDLF